ncbi:bifunctional folylpolyglutamate synthase/dihydrofolate synthase [Opitutus terrae]|uniref:tetrahydrofolate synthase n=1 Tax=Opitutus terrae (strain DSM 11246 / JCM 15787 / PB90-1) TaxID=452637 RepID=B1ZQM6_OPITP|nr:folylpolyglutamate synthase/dihydrofolate synthase family protein [Opitutus terrae]ACB75635.1 FolC bifunctional protein [Opitutus terrae PB90-1]
MSDYTAATRYLLELKTRGVALGLERMRRFVALLGDPHLAVPCIHVAGTNGKGSVAAMLEAILRSAGWRTGLYTSPHLVRLGERVQVNRRSLAEHEIAGYVEELRRVAEGMEAEQGAERRPSYFEFMTALAFLHFQRSGCDVAVIEVGLGGRLDATNVVEPEVSVITSIGLDHVEQLGPTLLAIAGEKAGIIKRGRPVVIGRLSAEAEQVIRSVAAEQHAPLVSVRADFGEAIEHYPRTNLPGHYQRWNAATATLAACALPARWRIDGGVIERALQQVDWPGRWQRFAVDRRTVILDTSHNPEGMEVLDSSLARLVAETGRQPIIVAGALGPARARALLPVVCLHAAELRLVVPRQSRACSFEQLESLVPADFRGRVERSSVDALFPGPDQCTAGEPGGVVVVTGSIYLVGEVLARLEPERGPDDGQLQDF